MAPFIEDPMISKRQSVLLLGTTVSSADLPPASSVQEPGTEVASNSQVDDLGNGKHLEQQKDSESLFSGPTGLYKLPADILLAKTGTGFRLEGDHQSMSGDLDALSESQPSSFGHNDSLLERSIPGTKDTSFTESTGSLEDELREAYCDTASKQRSEFLPIDALDGIITEDRVDDIIGKSPKGLSVESGRSVQQILCASMIPGQTTSRKKIFAILALIDKLEAIWDFVAEDIYDIHLPFEKQKAQTVDGSKKGRLELTRRSDTCASARIPVKASHGWTGAAVTSFERTQWDVHVPIFFLNTQEDPKVRHYRLQDSVILPFIEDDEVKHGGKVGGFADVWRVKFHPSHHNQRSLAPGKSENPSFAIKRLRNVDENAFQKEVENLKRFSKRDYLHLIKLLGTYEWRRQFYLIFPWADGNLLDFWEEHTEPLAHAHNSRTALWFSEQCLGLVEGMNMIHTWDTPGAGGEDGVFSFPIHQTHGFHGDLKPQNILWFKQRRETGEQDSSLGHFKICDFGLSHFHETKSIADIDAKDTGFSPTYQAPERDVKGKLAQSYDIWSLGCVLLEFATWYLGGNEELGSFRQKRVNEDRQYDGGYKSDRFFNSMRATHGVLDEAKGTAQICAVEKLSVVREFKRLYDDPHCSDYLLDFLELVQTGLLRLGPQNRKACTEITKSLRGLHANLQKDPDYGTNRVKKPPCRSPTLDSVLIDREISLGVKRKILMSVPRTGSFDRETACNSTSISVALSSSSSPSLLNHVSNTVRDSRPSSPERKAAFRLSIDMTTVQERLGTQAREEVETEQHPHSDAEAAVSEDTAQMNKRRTSSADNLTGLNILFNGSHQLESKEEQHQRPSDIQNTQQTPSVDSAASEVESTEPRLGAVFDELEVSDQGSPSEAECAVGVEEQAKKDHDGESLSAMDATVLPKAEDSGQPSHPTGDADNEDRISSNGVPRDVGPAELLKVPPHRGEERPSSESTTLFHDTSDAGQDGVQNRRTRNSSQMGSHGREMTAKQIGNAETAEEDKRVGRRWFKFIFKKIPCFN